MLLTCTNRNQYGTLEPVMRLNISERLLVRVQLGGLSEKVPHPSSGRRLSRQLDALAAQQLSLTHCPSISAQLTASFCDLPSGASVVTLPVVPSTVTVIFGSPILTSCGARSA